MAFEVAVTAWDPGLRVELHDGFVADTDRARLDLAAVHQWLSTDAFWALDRPFDVVEQTANASVNFGVYSPAGEQVGYARVFTDGVTFGWLCDVYIARQVRGRGLGTALSTVIVEALRPLRLHRVMLSTVDAHELYAKTGFIPFPDPQKLMVLGPDETS